MSTYQDDFSDLLGAYALDAVEPVERERIEAHLRTCPWCAAEVAEHREVAAFLSQSGTDAPEGVWDRIAAELSPPAPPLRMSFSTTGEVDPLAEVASRPSADAVAPAPTTASVVPFAARSVRLRTFAAALAVAACLLAAVGFVAYDQGRGTSAPRGETADAELEVKLKGSSDLEAVALVDRSGKGTLVATGLPNPDQGDLYQLWGQVDGVVFSLGTFNGGTDVVPFHVDPERLDAVEGFMVTEEKAPGVSVSSQEPMMAGTVA